MGPAQAAAAQVVNKAVVLELQNNGAFYPQIREQMSGPDLHVFTLKFLALKKLVFPQ